MTEMKRTEKSTFIYYYIMGSSRFVRIISTLNQFFNNNSFRKQFRRKYYHKISRI